MTILEIILIGLALSMDAIAVSISNRMAYPCLTRRQIAAMPVLFGVFQAAMPIAGFFAGSLFAQYITQYSGIVILAILGILGGKMIYEGLRHKDETCECKPFSMGMLVAQAVATSIDAFAVGVGFSVSGTPLFPAVVVIGLITAACSVLALMAGKKLGTLFGSKAEVIGGIILVLIGVKAMWF